MVEALKPTDMQSLLTHDRRYRRALALLNGTWQAVLAEEPQRYRQQILIDDVRFAVALMRSGAVKSTCDFDSYAGVQHLIRRWGSLLSTEARGWMLGRV
ncbi:hypothetical protein [Lactiplantibacillus modestisalitolerans]|uniref:Uncharacterized protein n=1 Tax=Lactiplantibacillus modestisalitolerans TaxID=1457219 RepID=A0ABV5WS76_9LACO|nr:hypothetical protein [Lactiplantibacillus modestisalitolerans]